MSYSAKPVVILANTQNGFDRKVVEDLKNHTRLHDRVFSDADIVGGTEYNKNWNDAVLNAHTVVVVLSSDALADRNLIQRWQLARQAKRNVVLVNARANSYENPDETLPRPPEKALSSQYSQNPGEYDYSIVDIGKKIADILSSPRASYYTSRIVTSDLLVEAEAARTTVRAEQLMRDAQEKMARATRLLEDAEARAKSIVRDAIEKAQNIEASARQKEAEVRKQEALIGAVQEQLRARERALEKREEEAVALREAGGGVPAPTASSNLSNASLSGTFASVMPAPGTTATFDLSNSLDNDQRKAYHLSQGENEKTINSIFVHLLHDGTPKNSELAAEMAGHLKLLERQNLVKITISDGQSATDRDKALAADILLPLISPGLLDDKRDNIINTVKSRHYPTNKHCPTALIPLRADRCDIIGTVLEPLQILPRDSNAYLNQNKDLKDERMAAIVTELRGLAQRMAQPRELVGTQWIKNTPSYGY